LGADRLHHPRGVLGVDRVGLEDRRRRRAALGEAGLDRRLVVAAPAVGEVDVGPGAAEGEAGGEADPGGAAGDQGGAALEVADHGSSSVRRPRTVIALSTKRAPRSTVTT